MRHPGALGCGISMICKTLEFSFFHSMKHFHTFISSKIVFILSFHQTLSSSLSCQNAFCIFIKTPLSWPDFSAKICFKNIFFWPIPCTLQKYHNRLEYINWNNTGFRKTNQNIYRDQTNGYNVFLCSHLFSKTLVPLDYSGGVVVISPQYPLLLRSNNDN